MQTTATEGLVIGLLRVSTDTQDVKRQRDAIQRKADELGVTVHEWLEDKLSRDNAKNRPAFQRMLDLVFQGRANLVLVEKFDRIGVADADEWGYYRYIFRDNHCKVLSVADGDITGQDPATFFKGYFAADASKQEQRNIGHRTLSGKQLKAKEGEWCGGPAPFGFDKVCLDERGQECWRLIKIKPDLHHQVFPDGKVIVLEGRQNTPRKSRKTEKLKLIRSEKNAPIVRRIFTIWTSQRCSILSVAVTLNREGITHHGKPFEMSTIKKILKNRKYLGEAVWNENLGGRFKEIKNGQVVDIPDEVRETKLRGKKKKYIARKSTELIIKHNAHDAIIDPDTFQHAQEKLAEVKDNKKHRASRRDEFWLKGLLVCGHCGAPMEGARHKGKPWYCCSTYHRADRLGLAGVAKCGRNTIAAETIEQHLLDWIKTNKIRLEQMPDCKDVQGVLSAVEELVHDSKQICGDGWHGFLTTLLADFCQGDLVPEERRLKQLCMKMARMEYRQVKVADLVEMDDLRIALCGHHLEDLETELVKAYRQKAKADSEREEGFWKQEAARIEGQMERYKQWAVPLRQRYVEIVKRIDMLTPHLQEIVDQWTSGSNRHKAEAVRKVIGQIQVFFRKELNTSERIRAALQELGRDASWQEIAKHLGMKAEKKFRDLVGFVRSWGKKRKSKQSRYFYVLEKVQICSRLDLSPEQTGR
jgi:DNA invertase Pin-like site-specific DNA recombinase